MTERIQSLPSTGFGYAETAPGAATAQRGEYRGEGVIAMKDAASLLESAAEGQKKKPPRFNLETQK